MKKAKRKTAKLRPLYPNDNNVTAGGDALPGACTTRDDGLDIPPFLRISQERRKAAWREFYERR